jgi:hypothetical protein
MHQDDTQPKWSGEERRGIDGMTIRLMAEVRAAMEKHEQMEAKQFQELDKRIDVLTKRLEGLCTSVTVYMEKTPETIIERMEELLDDAFPDDPEMPDATPSEKRKMHRKYHAKLIAAALEAQATQKEVKKHVFIALIEKVFPWVAMALATYFGLKMPGG